MIEVLSFSFLLVKEKEVARDMKKNTKNIINTKDTKTKQHESQNGIIGSAVSGVFRELTAELIKYIKDNWF
jgi:hypothetical protein